MKSSRSFGALLAALLLTGLLAACGGQALNHGTAGSALSQYAAVPAQGSGTSGDLALGSAQAKSASSDPITQAQGDRPIIQNARVGLRIRSGHFWDAYNQAVTIAQGFGGYLTSSSVGKPSADGDPIDNGTVVVRVPIKSYGDALLQLQRLGTTTDLQVTTEDVSQQYVDLQARLRNQQAQQTLLLQLMQRAQSISDSIAVQNQLSPVTQEIERIEGQLRYLDSQTAFSTITLNLFVTAPATRPSEPSVWDRSGIGNAIGTAAQTFAGVVDGMIIVLGFVLPFALLIGLGLLGWRLLPPRMRPTLR